MKQHNTHLLSEQSNEDHGYEYDNFGNVIADSLDDLIYDKFVDIQERKIKKYNDTKNLIKNITKNVSHQYYDMIPPLELDKQIRSKKKSVIVNSINLLSLKDDKIVKKAKRKSMIDFNRMPKRRNQSEENESENKNNSSFNGKFNNNNKNRNKSEKNKKISEDNKKTKNKEYKTKNIILI